MTEPIRRLQLALWAAEEELAAERERNRDLAAGIVAIHAELERQMFHVERLLRRLAEPSPALDRRRPRRHQDQSRWASAQRQAAARHKPWSLGRSEYEALAGSPCHYCGQPTGKGIGLDRIDNKVGYEPGNVLPCCGGCNLTRGGRYSVTEMEQMMHLVRSGRS